MDRVKNTVGINSFVKRQIKGSGKTYSLLSFNEIAELYTAFIVATLFMWGDQ